MSVAPHKPLITPDNRWLGSAVPYNPIDCVCPKCGNINPRVVGGDDPIRNHRCQHCGLRFRSIERPRFPTE